MTNHMRQLLQALAERTEDGTITWQAFDDESFRTPVGIGYVHIQRGATRFEDEYGEMSSPTTYAVQVADSQGRVVDDIELIEGANFADFKLAADLFRVARSSGLNSDQVITGMLNALSPTKNP